MSKMRKYFLIFLLCVSANLFGQIKADGKTDDLPALNAWAKAGGITPLPSNTVIRITSTWFVGAQPFDNSNLFSGKPVYNLDKLHQAQYTREIDIIGKNVMIWLDNPDTTMPVISYNAQGLNTNGTGGTIQGITLKGKGIGIVSCGTKNLKLYDLKFIGFKNGLVLNMTNRLDGRNLNFQNCQRAEHDIGAHCTNFYGISVGACAKGFEIHSNNTTINGYNSSLCGIGLHVAAGNNLIQNVHLETAAKFQSDAQLIIGDTTGIKVDGNVFIVLVVTAPEKTGIRFLRTAGMVDIIGGGAQSCSFDFQGKPVVDVRNFLGSLKKELLKL